MSGPANEDPRAEADRQRRRALRYLAALEALTVASQYARAYIRETAPLTAGNPPLDESRAAALADPSEALEAAEALIFP